MKGQIEWQKKIPYSKMPLEFYCYKYSFQSRKYFVVYLYINGVYVSSVQCIACIVYPLHTASYTNFYYKQGNKGVQTCRHIYNTIVIQHVIRSYIYMKVSEQCIKDYTRANDLMFCIQNSIYTKTFLLPSTYWILNRPAATKLILFGVVSPS